MTTLRRLLLATLTILCVGAGFAHAQVANPFAGRGMWIWELWRSDGGNVSAIIAQAQRTGMRTLMIKAGDGSSSWSQFNPQLVSRLHANGLRVCAWQYVYGTHPVAEANVGAAAVRAGADCLLIDAESEYEGKYIQAQTYLKRLRTLIGLTFPVGLAGFPYIDYHPAFPYSVFLGPNGAQYNVPQMYWVDIGTTVDRVYQHTFTFNLIYDRPIDPLGQVYQNPAPSQIVRFRALSRPYGARGVSWWDWQEATGRGWTATSRPIGSLQNYAGGATMALIRIRSRGDLVVWAQEHLISAGYRIPVDGAFGAKTQSAVKRFQFAQGLTPDGTVGPVTWAALLRYAAAPVVWTKTGAHAARAPRGHALSLPVPSSAQLRPKRNEIAHAGGAGR